MDKGSGASGQRKRLGGASAGYLLLAVTAVFLANTLVRAVQTQVFDEVVVAMIGLAALYCLIGVILIAVFTHAHQARAVVAAPAARVKKLVTE